MPDKYKLCSDNAFFRKMLADQLLSFCVVLVVVSSIAWILEAVKIIELIIKHDAPIINFLEMSIYLFPYILYTIVPIAVLFSVLHVMRQGIETNEVVVMKTLGLSSIQIAKPLIVFAIIVSIFHYALSLYILPSSHRHFKQVENKVSGNCAGLLLADGTFSNKIKDIIIYADKKVAKNKFSKIFIYDARDTKKASVITAEYADATQDLHNDLVNLSMHNGSYQEFDKHNNRTSILMFDDFIVNISIADYKAKINIDTDANALYVHEMFGRGAITMLDDEAMQKQQHDKIVAHGHNRLVWPSYSMIEILIVAIIILNIPLSRAMGIRRYFVLAFVCNFLVIIWGFALHNLLLHNIKYAWTAYVNIMLIPILCYILWKRKG